MFEYHKKIIELSDSKTPFVSVTMVDNLGSTPQDQGAKMIVTNQGLYFGTIGGGKVEKKAIEEAKDLILNKTVEKFKFLQWSLNKDVGMTCGGTVKLFFELYNISNWNICIFGAGHVSNALINILINLDCHITCIDIREEWLNKLPQSPKISKILTSNMPDEVKNIKENSFVVLMTMGHTTDKPILLEILKTREFPYLGVIGSKAKSNILKKDIEDFGLPSDYKDKFYCPLGLDFGTNDINEISISIIAQLIQERDKYFKLIKG